MTITGVYLIIIHVRRTRKRKEQPMSVTFRVWRLSITFTVKLRFLKR